MTAAGATLLLRRASLRPGVEADLLIVDGRLSDASSPAGVDVIDLDGRPVLPAFTDHHVHLLALAASWASVDLSPAAIAGGGGLAETMRSARVRHPEGWLRGIGYDVAGSGPLDRWQLDALGVGPVRIQDRTGIQWILDGAGLDAALPADRDSWPDGVHRDATGTATGVLTRLDGWLRARLPATVPDLAGVGRWLAARGVTSATDAGATNGPAELALLAAAGLPQRVVAMTGDVIIDAPPGLDLGPVKVLLDDDRLPPIDELGARISAAHAAGRGVAVHCVTDVQIAFALAAGIGRGDRIEHATYPPDGLLSAVAQAGPTLVVQPGLVATRGDRYLEDHAAREHSALHRLGSLRRAGLRVAAGSDAPFGPADPWTIVAAAVDRTTADGRRLGVDEGVDPGTALAFLSSDPHDPGRPATLCSGRPADLIVLDDDWSRVAHHPAVLATYREGQLIAGRRP